MKLLELPNEIIREIYFYDRTYKEKYDTCMKELTVCMLDSNILEKLLKNFKYLVDKRGHRTAEIFYNTLYTELSSNSKHYSVNKNT